MANRSVQATLDSAPDARRWSSSSENAPFFLRYAFPSCCTKVQSSRVIQRERQSVQKVELVRPVACRSNLRADAQDSPGVPAAAGSGRSIAPHRQYRT